MYNRKREITMAKVSLDAPMKEFNQMVSQQHTQDDQAQTETVVSIPTWSKILEPIVALAVLWVLASAACNIFA